MCAGSRIIPGLIYTTKAYAESNTDQDYDRVQHVLITPITRKRKAKR